MNNYLKVIETKDGSHTIYNDSLKETYHSTHGAYTESELVYVKNGLEYLVSNNIKEEYNILELGFGTGLNAFLSCIFSDSLSSKIRYTSLELYPLEDSIINILNYPEIVSEKKGLNLDHCKRLFDKIHSCPWGGENVINDQFTFTKVLTDISNYRSDDRYDLVYFDAFAPSKQPEIWELSILNNISNLLVEEGILVTYCCQTTFRKSLEDLGLEVSKLPGPPGKKEVLRGTKPSQILKLTL